MFGEDSHWNDEKVQDQRIEVSYSDGFDETRGNIIKANDEFVNYLEQFGEIVVEGNEEDDFIFSTDTATFKMKQINLPTTMLVTRAMPKECGDISTLNLITIVLETHNYLKVQNYEVPYHEIYWKIAEDSFSEQALEAPFDTVIQEFAIDFTRARKYYKISPVEFLRMTTLPNFARVDFCQEGRITDAFIFINTSVLLAFVRKLLSWLMESDPGRLFSYLQAFEKLPVPAVVFVAAMLKFHFQERLQERVAETKYCLTMESIVRFVLLEMGMAKQEYLLADMETILKEMLYIYTPVGPEQFSQVHCTQVLKDIIGSYFLTIRKRTIVNRVYYDPNLIQHTINGRVKFMAKHKNRFNESELKGIFDCMLGKEAIDLGDVVIKHFRKFGDEYELKMIIPK